jgi:tripartite-type tricarboxylate transporter receptor subunit TctC
MKVQAQFSLLLARCAAACAALIAATSLVAAQGYPNRTVRIIVATAPGGATDVTTRLVAQKMSDKLGQQVIVENKPGGDTLIGILHVKQQPADGYTLLAQSLNFSTLPYIKNDPGYTPSDFVGIGKMTTIPFIMIVGGDQPEKTLADYIARAKSQKLSYGHGGVAGAPQIAAELFLKQYGLNATSVAYKGNGAVMPDIMAGRVSMFFDAYVSSGGHLRSGKMRALAIAAPSRIAPLSDVPTFKELGKDFSYSVWLGLLARKETPPDVVEKLSEALRFALDDLGPRFRNEGGDPTFMKPQEFTAFLAKEYAEMGQLAQELKWEKQ